MRSISRRHFGAREPRVTSRSTQARALVLCGPTASGKSELALTVAEAIGAEIINADSRQIYRGMEIGTGMPSRSALRRVPHHGYAIVDPVETYNAALYARDAAAAVNDVWRRGRLPLVVGGSGFYIEALTGDRLLDRPPPEAWLRERLRREAEIHSPEALWEWLSALDATARARVPHGDSYRTLRGLELALTRNRGAADTAARTLPKAAAFRIAVLTLGREALRQRIDVRVRAMFENGLLDEARVIRRHAPHAPALSGIGYAEALSYEDGLATWHEAIAAAQRRTARYAKRQETWFRHMRSATIVSADDAVAAANALTHMARELAAAA